MRCAIAPSWNGDLKSNLLSIPNGLSHPVGRDTGLLYRTRLANPEYRTSLEATCPSNSVAENHENNHHVTPRTRLEATSHLAGSNIAPGWHKYRTRLEEVFAPGWKQHRTRLAVTSHPVGKECNLNHLF